MATTPNAFVRIYPKASYGAAEPLHRLAEFMSDLALELETEAEPTAARFIYDGVLAIADLAGGQFVHPYLVTDAIARAAMALGSDYADLAAELDRPTAADLAIAFGAMAAAVGQLIPIAA
jgi:hypothetical protein